MNKFIPSVIITLLSSLMVWVSIILTSLSLVMPLSAQAKGLGDLFDTAGSTQSQFLPVNEAFQVAVRSNSNNNKTSVIAEFTITPGHYVYRDKIKLSLPKGVTAGPLTFSQPAHYIEDPQFGRVAVFDQTSVTATTVLSNTSAATVDNAPLSLGWQGCAKAGLCYPPEKVNATVSLPASSKAAATQAATTKTTQNTEAASSISNSKAESDKSLNKSAENTATTNKSVVVPPQSASQQNGKDLNAAAKAALAPSNVGNNGESDSLKDPALTNADGLDNAQSAEALQGTIEEGANLDSTDNSTDINVNATNVSDSDVNTTAILGSRAETDKSGIDNQVNNAQMGKSLVATDPFGLATHPWLALGLLFLAGLGLAFTACVYPMIPIVANIVAHQHNPSALKGMLLTAGYALGVASAYGILGAIIAVFGEALGIIGWLQNPIILISFAAVFVLLALYMLEAFTIKLPTRISNKLNHVSQSADSKLGSFGGSVIAGALSALVVSPCVSAPLFGALTAVSTIGNPLLGFAALFMLGFGLSAPLLLLGVTQGNFMPKAGPWMVWVKQGFALLLLAVALLLVERVFMTPMMLIAWAIWFMVIAIWAWSWQGRGGMFTKALSMVAGGWALTLIIGAALGNSDSLQPLASINNQRQDSRLESGLVQDQVQNLPSNVGSGHNKVSTLPMHMTTLTELDGIIKASDNVLVDVTADWCVECRIMDKALFASPPPELSNWQVVKLDITETTPDSKAILARYRLFGPPALLYYQQGELVGQQVGDIKRADFVQTLTQLQ